MRLSVILLAAITACGARTDRFTPGGRARTSATTSTVCVNDPLPDLQAGGREVTRLAVIGDYGTAGPNTANVAALVAKWRPAAVFTTGDNNYPHGAAVTIDSNIGQYYHRFIAPYTGRFGCGAGENRFFPALGNHDWYSRGAEPYRDYFTLPGNERYYDVVIGHVHLFALDSDVSEPDGVTADSAQAAWLKTRLAASAAPWKIVYMHHPPYSSGPHLSTVHMRWPFKEWGADIVFAGHDHDYERFDIGGLPYIVNGLGGTSLYKLGSPTPGSLVRFDTNFGAVLIDAQKSSLTTQFIAVDGQVVDRLVLGSDR